MKRSPIRKVSKKMSRQKRQERKLSAILLEKCKGLCMRCGNIPDWRGLSKHEIVFRSHGGSATDENNTILVCGKCHAELHGIHENKSA